MSVYCKGDLHGCIIEAFSYRRNPELRELTKDDVLVICGDIGLGFTGADKTYKYILDFLAAKPFKVVLVRGNHDHTGVIRNCSVPSTGNRDTVKLITGTLCNPVYGDKIYDSIFWVSDSAILDLCGHRSLIISGASSQDVWHLVSPHEKERIKRLKQNRIFYRTIGKSWWPDEGINIPYIHSLLNEYLRDCNSRFVNLNSAFRDKRQIRYGDFDYIFTHDCPAFMTEIYSPYGPRLKSTINELLLENIRKCINYRWFVHGHMHTFKQYASDKDEYGQHDVVCLYKELMKLPDGKDSIFQDWEHICTCRQQF